MHELLDRLDIYAPLADAVGLSCENVLFLHLVDQGCRLRDRLLADAIRLAALVGNLSDAPLALERGLTELLNAGLLVEVDEEKRRLIELYVLTQQLEVPLLHGMPSLGDVDLSIEGFRVLNYASDVELNRETTYFSISKAVPYCAVSLSRERLLLATGIDATNAQQGPVASGDARQIGAWAGRWYDVHSCGWYVALRSP